MTQESNAALLQAYKYATEADQDGIADLLETVILELMDSGNQSPIILGDSRTTTDPPWKISCGPDVVPLDKKAIRTEIDHMSKEMTV